MNQVILAMKKNFISILNKYTTQMQYQKVSPWENQFFLETFLFLQISRIQEEEYLFCQ